MAIQAVVGVGANLGDRLATMRAAVARLADVADVLRTSSVYSTAPVGPPQPDFLNAAVLVAHAGEPLNLLDELLGIEASLGRVRERKWEARVIDLDLLWAGPLIVDTPRLTLPHLHLRERAFALIPLLEIVPGAVDPRSGAPYAVPPGEVTHTDFSLGWPRESQRTPRS